MKLLKSRGFTIVELLIVIVVIGILAALTIVAYNGIVGKSQEAQLKSDLNGAAKILAIDNTQNGNFPTSAASANGGKGIPKSSDTTLTYSYNPGSNTYCLTGSNSKFSYTITSTQTAAGSNPCSDIFAGAADGSPGRVDNVGVNAKFNTPGSLRVAPDNMLYLADGTTGYAYIRKIDPTTAAVSTAAMAPNTLFDALYIKSDGTIFSVSPSPTPCLKKIVSGVVTTITCSSSVYGNVRGITMGTDGNLYGADSAANVIYRINPTTGASAVLAGSSYAFADGTGTAARFSSPWEIVAAPDGALYVSDLDNNRIRKVTLAGAVTTVAGTGGCGDVNGAALTTAQICAPNGLTVDANGTLYFSDYNGKIRSLKNGVVATLASGMTYGFPAAIAASPVEDGAVFVNSYNGNRIYKIR